MYYIGIDVGGTNLKAGLVDENGKILEVERIPLDYKSPEQFAQVVAGLAKTVSAKGGVAQITKAFAHEWGGRGVRVNAVAPAYVYTPITAHRIDNPDDPYVPTWNYMNPMGRVGQPDEIAGAALYFACDASSYTTGAILPVDGGYTCW